MNKKKYFIIIVGILTYIFILLGQERIPIEELETVTGIGYDVERKGEDIIQYCIPISTTIFKPGGMSVNLVFKGQGQNIGEVIQKRQEEMSKKFVQGQERVVLVSEDYARYGLKTLLDDRFRNAEANDMAYMVVCKGKAGDYLKYKVKGYNNASEYIGGLVETAVNYNFFGDDYKLIDAYVRIGAEGRCLLLPYIEITENGIEITGIAIFKEDKMIALSDEKNSRMLNILKNDGSKGILSLQKTPEAYIDFEGKTGKRKVRCNKQGDKYSFNVDLMFIGTVINNEMYIGIEKEISKKKEFEKDMAKTIEKECYDFLNIMKNDYKVDCISLGKIAAAKYGRQKKIDWDTVVCNADIKVNVKVKVDSQGRGDY